MTDGIVYVVNTWEDQGGEMDAAQVDSVWEDRSDAEDRAADINAHPFVCASVWLVVVDSPDNAEIVS